MKMIQKQQCLIKRSRLLTNPCESRLNYKTLLFQNFPKYATYKMMGYYIVE